MSPLLAALRLSVAIAIGCAPLAPPARAAVSAVQEESSASDLSPEERERLQARWDRLSAEEKRSYREQYERYLAMSASDREALGRRAERIRALEKRIELDLDPEKRRWLDAQPAARRTQILREMAAHEARDIDQRLLEKFPPRLRARYEAAQSQVERDRILQEFRKHKSRLIDDAIAILGPRIGVDAEKLAELEELPSEARHRKFLEFAQAISTEEIGRHDLPPGLSPERWERMKALPPVEFFETLLYLRRQLPELDRRPGDPPLDDAQHEASLAAPLPVLGEAQRAAFQRFWEALHPSTDELAGLFQGLETLSPGERRAEILRLRRERLLDSLRRERLFGAEQIDELAALPVEQFFRIMQSWMHEQRRRFAMARDDARRPRPDATRPEAEHAAPRGLEHEVAAAARQHWQALSDAQRADVLERYDRCVAQSKVREERLAQLDRVSERELTLEEREGLRLASAAERAETLRKKTLERLRATNAPLYAGLPPELRERLLLSTPDDVRMMTGLLRGYAPQLGEGARPDARRERTPGRDGR